MPFLTQGKTNWKFLLIVIVLAVIVGGAILWCQRTSEQPYQLTELEETKRVVEDEATNWKIFAHPYYQFQIRVPLDWGAGHFTSFFPFEHPVAGEVRSVPFCPPDITGSVYCEDCCELIKSAPGAPSTNPNPILLFICDASGSLCETKKEFEAQYYEAFTSPDLEDAIKRVDLQLNRDMSESWGRTPKMELVLFDATHEEIFDDMVFSFENFYSGWQVYRNEKYGFEFEYPKEWQYIKEKDEWGFGVYFRKDPQDRTYFVIGVNLVADFPSAFAQCVRSEDIEITGVKRKKTNYWSYASPPLKLTLEQCKEDPSLTNIYSSVRTEDYLYEFAFFCQEEGWEGEEGREKCNALYDQMLSTFRFIEVDKTTDWQTYRNDDLGVAFKYPEEWKPEECINLAKYSKDLDSHCDLWINFISPDGNIFYKSKPDKNVSLKDYFCPAVKSHPYSILYPWNTYDPWEINSPLYCSEVQVDTGYKGVVKNIIIWTTKPCPPPPIPCGDVDLYYSQYLNIFHIYLNSQDYPVLMVAKKWGRECFEERCGELTEPGEKLTYCMKEAYDECKKANKTELEIFDNLIKTIQIF